MAEPPPMLSPTLTADEARAVLQGAGWTPLAEGDWSWVHASPDGLRVMRVTPWDDAYRLHARACLENTGQAHLPRVDAILPLKGLAYAVLMERLTAALDVEAKAFLARIGLDTPERPADDGLRAVKDIVQAVEAAGRARSPFWGGFDTNPSNVMRGRDGRLKLVDPVYVAGLKIMAALEAHDGAALRQLSDAQLLAFTQIPAVRRHGEEAQLRARFEALLGPLAG